MRQGEKADIDKIVWLLRHTDTTAGGIARRMNVSRSTIHAINKKYNVRLYNGKRSTWALA